MNLTVNGKAYKHNGKATIQALLDEMSINCAQVAVMVNDAIVSRKKLSSTELAEGDRIEIVTLVGGG